MDNPAQALDMTNKEVQNLARKLYAIARSSTEFDPVNEIAFHLSAALRHARREAIEQTVEAIIAMLDLTHDGRVTITTAHVRRIIQRAKESP